MVKKNYELLGVKVLEKTPRHIYSGKHAGKEYYRLNIVNETKPEIQYIDVYKDKLGLAGSIGQEAMWTDIVASNYADKRYLFYYQYEKFNISLVGWKELSNHG